MNRWITFAFAASLTSGCTPAAPPGSPAAVAPTGSISVPDPTLDILVAAADSVLPHFGPPDEKFYVDDSVTARVLDQVGARGRYTRISADKQVSCDGSTSITGIRGSMRVYGLFGDTASVAWSATCLVKPAGQSEARAAGKGGTYNVAKSGDNWLVTGAGLLFDF